MDLEAIAQTIASWHYIGYDTETTGLSEDDRMFSCSFGNPDGESFYFNFNNIEAPSHCVLDREMVFDVLGEYIFFNENITLHIVNAKFDWRMTRHELRGDLKCRVVCREAMERVLRNDYLGKKPYSLAAMSERRGWAKDDSVEKYISEHSLFTLVDVPGKAQPKKHKHFDKVPFGIIEPYASLDAVLHAKVAKDQDEKFLTLEDPRYPSISRVRENEVQLTRVCYEMERLGVKIDRARAEAARDYEFSKIARYKMEFQSLTGHAYSDSRTLFKSVFDAVGEKYPTTDKGNASFAAEVLEGMSSPVASIINKIRYHQKRVGTYYSSFLYFADKNDFIHPNMRQAGTATGRFSYSDPNLQNMPKEDEPEDQELPYHVRECIVPPTGEMFFSLDYSQMEYRMLADYAGEMRLIKAIMAGEDVHEATARLCGITRKQAKTLNFAILYGAGPEKIAKMLGVETREASQLRRIYLGNLPMVRRFIDEVTRSGKARGFIFNWIGRRCYISNRDWAYVLTNHLIQGGAADVIKLAMVKIRNSLLEKRVPLKMRLQVHDELNLTGMSELQEHIPLVKDIMESVYEPRNGVKLITSLSVSKKSLGYRDLKKC